MADFKEARLKIGAKLQTYCPNVYYRSPESCKMIFPAIRYEVARLPVDHADNGPYRRSTIFTITVIEQDPDMPIAERIRATMSCCRHDRTYRTGGMVHNVFTVYF